MERAATTASSLEAERDSGNINRTQSMATLNESFPHRTNSGLKRLRKVGSVSRVESSNDVSLGAQEDASKQGRKIVDLYADAEVTLTDETQERYDEEMLFDVQDDLQGEEVVAEKECYPLLLSLHNNKQTQISSYVSQK
ncbi:hypothetical protein Tco_1027986 [Tanacetum coccineum]